MTSQVKHIQPAPAEPAQPQPKRLERIASRILGVGLLILSFAVYLQLVPLSLVLVGGMMGLGADDPVVSADGVVWILSSAAMLAPMVYFFIRWVQYLWVRFIRRPSLSTLFAWSRK